MKQILIPTILATSLLVSACSTTKVAKPPVTDPALLAKWFNGENVEGIKSYRTQSGRTIFSEDHVIVPSTN